MKIQRDKSGIEKLYYMFYDYMIYIVFDFMMAVIMFLFGMRFL